VVQEALAIPWRRREDFAWALALPLALLAALALLWYFAAELLRPLSGWALYFTYCGLFAAFFTLFAVSCHRLVLLAPPRRLGILPRPVWSRRESRFLFWMLTLWILFAAIWWLGLVVAANVGGRQADFEGWFKVLEFTTKLPAFYVIARLSLVFPATAVDRDVGLRWAWRTSRGNGWRLVVVVTVLPWLVSHLVGFLYRDEPSAVEIVLLTLFGTALFAIEIAALSIAYRELTKDEGRSLDESR
jgi:hypothetical protein